MLYGQLNSCTMLSGAAIAGWRPHCPVGGPCSPVSRGGTPAALRADLCSSDDAEAGWAGVDAPRGLWPRAGKLLPLGGGAPASPAGAPPDPLHPTARSSPSTMWGWRRASSGKLPHGGGTRPARWTLTQTRGASDPQLGSAPRLRSWRGSAPGLPRAAAASAAACCRKPRLRRPAPLPLHAAPALPGLRPPAMRSSALIWVSGAPAARRPACVSARCAAARLSPRAPSAVAEPCSLRVSHAGTTNSCVAVMGECGAAARS